MKRIYPILLIGLLSMLFAEIFSGASTTWFFNPWGIFLTLPLYLFHVLFFMWIAMQYKRTSLQQLYLFGVIFALYEAWVTKVLWAGYMDAEGLGMGTILGVGVAEFSVLVFFWHPIMSFVIPVLVFQILTGTAFSGHVTILQKSRRSLIVVLIAILLSSSFIANGNSFNIVSANISVLGTLLLIFVTRKLAAGSNIQFLHFSKKYFRIVAAYLVILYVATFVFLLPEKIPITLIPYIPIILSYIIVVTLLLRSKESSSSLETLHGNSYSAKDVFVLSIVLLLGVNFACLAPSVSTALLTVTYLSLVVAGPILFLKVCSQLIRKSSY